jgi:hypothetical protein
VLNAGESGIASWNFSFFGVQSTGNIVQAQSLVSSASGEFFVSFSDAGISNWYIQVAPPTGWEPTGNPMPGTSDIFRVPTDPFTESLGNFTFRLDRAFGFREVATGGAPTPPVSVPEPASLGLLGIGGIIMGVTRRRLRRER